MLYKKFYEIVKVIKGIDPDQKTIHTSVDEIVRELTIGNATESSLRLIKYLFFKLRWGHTSYTFFSDFTREYLESNFKRDPSNLVSTFLYGLSVYEQTSNVYLLEKITYSAWKFKKVVDESIRESKIYG